MFYHKNQQLKDLSILLDLGVLFTFSDRFGFNSQLKPRKMGRQGNLTKYLSKLFIVNN